MKIKGKLYGIILLFITLTGFAQMPIFKRYYTADIPGLGWLAEFYVIHSLHYILASALLCLAGYSVAGFLLSKRGLSSLTFWGGVKTWLILGLVVSGGLMVVRNLPGIYFSHVAIYLMNLSHLGFCVALLMVSGFTRAAGKPWVR
ncbi:MAG: hypothetical protein MI863_14635 [Desulfobacterales bacterium]|nr:hypothetical protein [Desulfobacterales bacterium]